MTTSVVFIIFVLSMKKSELVSVRALVRDALSFFADYAFYDLSEKERYVLLALTDVDSRLFNLDLLSDD